MQPTVIAPRIACVAAVLLLAGCPGNQRDSEQEVPDAAADLKLSIEPERLVARQNTSVVIHVDTPDAAAADLPSGYAFDLDEVVGHIDVTTAPCPAGTGSRACEDWTITPRAGSVPGTYFVNVQTVGSRAGRTSASFHLTVVSDPAPDLGAALQVAGRAAFRTLVLNTDHKLFVRGGTGHSPARGGYRRFGLPFESSDPLHDFGFEPGATAEFTAAAVPEDASWVAVAGEDDLFAVRDDGTVWSLHGDSPRPLAGLANVRSIATSRHFPQPHLALLADGRVLEFGLVEHRVLNADGTLFDTFIEAIGPRPFCEERHDDADTRLVACEREISEVSRMATLGDHYLFLKRDGTVWGGYLTAEPLPSAPSPAVALAFSDRAGLPETVVRLVVAADGTVWTSLSENSATGQPFTQVAGLSDIIAVDRSATAEGSERSRVNALRRDGTVWTFLSDGSGAAPTQVPGLSDIIGVGAGHALQGPCLGDGGRLWLIKSDQAIERLHGFGENCGTAARASIGVSVNGQGRIVSAPASIDCPGGLCRFFFPRDSRVALLPSPARGWFFNGWTGDADCDLLNRLGDVTANLSGDLNCVATFVEGGERRLDVQVDGKGSVTSTPAGIDCGGDCSEAYELGAGVQLAATPALGYRFDRFAGHDDCADGALTMSGVRTCSARFATLPAPAAPTGFTASADSSSVLLHWDAVNGPVVRYSLERADTSATFVPLIEIIPGIDAEIRDGSAAADTRYTYRLTAHNLNGASPPVTAVIGPLGPPVAVRVLAVRISNSGRGRVTTQPAGIDCSRTADTGSCAQNFGDATIVQLIATPDTGFRFVEWNGDADCVDGQVTMDANKQCEAVFASDAATFFLQFVPANIVGPGHVETDDLHIVCPSGDCAASYTIGSLVRVRAVPDNGALLEAWTGDCASFPALQTTIQFLMNSNVSCGAIFATRAP